MIVHLSLRCHKVAKKTYSLIFQGDTFKCSTNTPKYVQTEKPSTKAPHNTEELGVLLKEGHFSS